ncbi:MAG: hypothetical protein KTR15_04145 [Phycisphaeraceae bacterium]|nr:hypothetical protein [Phycisphaeraceae bacterium]
MCRSPCRAGSDDCDHAEAGGTGDNHMLSKIAACTTNDAPKHSPTSVSE